MSNTKSTVIAVRKYPYNGKYSFLVKVVGEGCLVSHVRKDGNPAQWQPKSLTSHAYGRIHQALNAIKKWSNAPLEWSKAA